MTKKFTVNNLLLFLLSLAIQPLIAYAIVFQVLNEPADVHCPVVEMSTRSKLSCLSWNKYWKDHIASSDYEGIVTVWDVTTRQVMRNLWLLDNVVIYHLGFLVIYFISNNTLITLAVSDGI